MQQPYQPGYSQAPAGAHPLPPGFGAPYNNAPIYQPHPQHMMMHGGGHAQQPFQMERTTVMVVSRVGPGHVGPHPCNMNCPFCRASVTTVVTRRFNGMGWLICLLLYVCTGFCCCLAFLCDSNYDAVHNCPACGGIVGRYSSTD